MILQNAVHAAVAAVCPIDGISFGSLTDKATWGIAFKPEATTPQRAAAASVLADFDVAAAQAPPSPDQLEQFALAALNGGELSTVDLRKLLKAMIINFTARALSVAPGALTPAQLLAERNRIAAIYKNL